MSENRTHAKTGKPSRLMYLLIPAVLLTFIAVLFAGWELMPGKKLNICVIDKTVLAAGEDGNDTASFYRKHKGLFWIINQRKYLLPDGSPYDYKKDYYGPLLDESYNICGERDITTVDYLPDLMYVADAYGSESGGNKGLNADDIAMISYSHLNGATVIAEMEVLHSETESAIASQLTSLCGINPTQWRGRYIFDLQDFTDVPEWAPPMYYQQEGTEWHFSGPGILLVSDAGRIIVLEQKTDFNSNNLLRISINKDYKEEFDGVGSCNFYNWFELTEAKYGTEIIADFEFDVNAVGMEKLAEVSSTPRFAAVTRKGYENRAPVYYFSGDFNDYTAQLNYNRFWLADALYRLFSYDRPGDIQNFFWNFYNPFMSKILDDVCANAEENSSHKTPDGEPAETVRIDNGRLQLLQQGSWVNFDIKGFGINAVMPGENQYTHDYYIYKDLISLLQGAGGNTIGVKSLLPAEFYRAVQENNLTQGKPAVYLMQRIDIKADTGKMLTDAGMEKLKLQIKATVDALHGKSVTREDRITYLNDVSQYVLGYIIDLNLTPENYAAFCAVQPDYSYDGKYFSGKNPAEGLYAMLADYAMEYHTVTYGTRICIGVSGNADLLDGSDWSEGYNTSKITGNREMLDGYFFTSYRLMPYDAVLAEKKLIFDFSDRQGDFQYGGYIEAVRKTTAGNMLVNGLGYSANTDIYEQDRAYNGMTEKQQGAATVRTLKMVSECCMGGIAADLNDDWTACSPVEYPYAVPSENNRWHNLTDITQTGGIVAMEALMPQSSMELSDLGRMRQVLFYANPEYLYLTVQLTEEVDYNYQQLFIGLDTYQRNDGEYRYDKNYFANSLSGMEFVIRFESKNSAELCVATSYTRSTDGCSSAESYAADFHTVTQLRYGNFSLSENHFYQTGSTVYIRLPWALLNFTDPSQRVVINDAGGNLPQVRTVTTNGIMFSLLIADRATLDTDYIFPITKQSTGYRAFSWQKWDAVQYRMREKDSYGQIRNYFNGD